ncbi:hypothetical protein LCGC14_2221030, partial [marine sediment metagenome]
TGGYIIAAAQTSTTDDLDGIGGGANGRVIVVRADAGDTITVKHSDAGGGSGRKLLTNDNASIALVGNDEDSITFMYDESLDSAAGAWFELSRSTGAGHAESHDYDIHSGGVPFAELEYDDATSDPLIDADSAADGTEDSAARKDHVHPKHHVKYLDSAAISAVEGEATLDLAGDVTIAVGKTLSVDVIAEKGAGTGVTVDGLLIKDKTLVSAWSTLTISTGQVTRTQMCHEISGEGGAADNLVGIAGGADGVFLYLHPTSDSVTITVKHMDAGGESTNGTRITFADNTDHDLDDIDDVIIFVYDSGLDSGNGAWIGLIPGGSAAGHAILSATHTDSAAAGVTDGSIIIGNVTPAWSELVISVPAANVRNVLGVDNGETRPSWKTALDGTAPADIANSASAGTSLVFAHRDHVHTHPSGLTSTLHHTKYTNASAISAVEGEATLDLAGDVTIAVGKSLAVDTIAEKGAGTGVTIDGLLIKDEYLEFDEIADPGAGAANKLRVYAIDISGTTGLQITDSAGVDTSIVARTRVIPMTIMSSTRHAGGDLQWNDGVTDIIQFAGVVPEDYVAGTDLYAEVFMHQTTTGGSPLGLFDSFIGCRTEGETHSFNIESPGMVA